MHMKSVAVAALLAFVSAPLLAGEKNVEDMVATCAACHGEKGVSTDPQYPHLAGQYTSFLERALLDYKSGERKNPIMAGQVANLSKHDIKAIARYFSKQSGPLSVPPAE